MDRKVIALLVLLLASLLLVTRSILRSERPTTLLLGLVTWGARANGFTDPLHPDGPTEVCRAIVYFTLPEDLLHQTVVSHNWSPGQARYPSLFFHACFVGEACVHNYRGRDEVEFWLDVDTRCPL